jgi:hypothetical protein
VEVHKAFNAFAGVSIKGEFHKWPDKFSKTCQTRTIQQTMDGLLKIQGIHVNPAKLKDSVHRIHAKLAPSPVTEDTEITVGAKTISKGFEKDSIVTINEGMHQGKKGRVINNNDDDHYVISPVGTDGDVEVKRTQVTQAPEDDPEMVRTKLWYKPYKEEILKKMQEMKATYVGREVRTTLWRIIGSPACDENDKDEASQGEMDWKTLKSDLDNYEEILEREAFTAPTYDKIQLKGETKEEEEEQLTTQKKLKSRIVESIDTAYSDEGDDVEVMIFASCPKRLQACARKMVDDAIADNKAKATCFVIFTNSHSAEQNSFDFG